MSVLEAVKPRPGTLSLGEAAGRLRVPRHALLAMRNGDGPMPIAGDRGEPRYDAAELDDWIAKHEVTRDAHGNVLRVRPRTPAGVSQLPVRVVAPPTPDAPLVAVWKAAERYRLATKLGEGIDAARKALWAALDACDGTR